MRFPFAHNALMQGFVFSLQLIGRFGIGRVLHDAFDRADALALRRIVGADAFGAARRVDDIDRVINCNCVIGAFRRAGAAGNAIVFDNQSHVGGFLELCCVKAVCPGGLGTKRQPTSEPITACPLSKANGV